MSDFKSSNPFLTHFIKSGASERLITQAHALTPDQLSRFLVTVDESPYSISEWVDAIFAFEEWAKKEGRVLSLVHELEYLSCCTESPRGGVTLPLAFLLTEFLKTNGVE